MTTTPTTTVAASAVTAMLDEHLDTWSDPDSAERLNRIRAIWEEDGAIVDPPLDGHGHEGISALMAAMQDHYPHHRFVRTSEVDTHHDVFRVAWELRGPDNIVALSGVDVGLLSNDGKLQRIAGFFGEMT